MCPQLSNCDWVIWNENETSQQVPKMPPPPSAHPSHGALTHCKYRNQQSAVCSIDQRSCSVLGLKAFFPPKFEKGFLLELKLGVKLLVEAHNHSSVWISQIAQRLNSCQWSSVGDLMAAQKKMCGNHHLMVNFAELLTYEFCIGLFTNHPDNALCGALC